MSKRVIVCEIYSRVCGYFRPVFQNWNAGKQAEFKDRKNYDVQKSLNHPEKKES